MLRLLLAWLMGAASTACALAAVGGVLYARSPELVWVLQCFAACGLVAGLVCGALQLHFHGRPAHAPAALPAHELANLVRAALASAATERQARPGSAADRQPAVVRPAPPAPVPQETPAPVARREEATSP